MHADVAGPPPAAQVPPPSQLTQASAAFAELLPSLGGGPLSLKGSLLAAGLGLTGLKEPPGQALAAGGSRSGLPRPAPVRWH